MVGGSTEPLPTFFPGGLAWGSSVTLRTEVSIARHLTHLDQPAVETGHLISASEQHSLILPARSGPPQDSPLLLEETVGDCHTVSWLVGQHLPLSSTQAVDTAGHGGYHDDG